MSKYRTPLTSKENPPYHCPEDTATPRTESPSRMAGQPVSPHASSPPLGSTMSNYRVIIYTTTYSFAYLDTIKFKHICTNLL